MNLIENTDFGLLCKSKEKEFTRRIDYLEWYEKQRNKYDNFVKQPLELSMFVPTDDESNVLRKPLKRDYNNVNINNSYYKEYEKAKQKVIFEGFEVSTAINQLSVTKQNIKIIFIKEKAKDFIITNVFLENLLTNQILEIKTIEDLVSYNLEIKNLEL